MIDLAKKLWPINRSITGEGLRKTLHILKEETNLLNIHEIPSGTKVFDWIVPKEWHVKEAWVKDSKGNKIIDFKTNNLHLVGYSKSVDSVLSLKELDRHLYSIPSQPDAIPYITSYYKKHWGFCLTHNQRSKLRETKYKVYINSEYKSGYLNYGEVYLKSTNKNSKEVFISSYICHPSMANNEISGPVVISQIAKWLNKLKVRNYNYRIIFIPETIGSISYLSKNLENLKKNVIAGFNISCVGDENNYSYLPSRNGLTLSDRILKHVLKHTCENYIKYEWKDRGSDERQYCAPGIDLPIASFMRSKYGEFPEYHTSLDNFQLVTDKGLSESYDLMKRLIMGIENNFFPIYRILGEPMLSRRGLYPTLSTKDRNHDIDIMMNILTWSDGSHDLIDIADLCEKPIWSIYNTINTLLGEGLITKKNIIE